MTAVEHRPRARRFLPQFGPKLPVGTPCTVCGKLRYATREAALNVTERASAKRQENRAYYVHGWWHLTSQDRDNAATAEEQES
jgi:hypothetical protein